MINEDCSPPAKKKKDTNEEVTGNLIRLGVIDKANGMEWRSEEKILSDRNDFKIIEKEKKVVEEEELLRKK